MKTVAVSGGFDPLHKGHVDMIEAAAEISRGDPCVECAHRPGRVHVYLNSDEWLDRKKGYKFMRWKDRARILMAIEGVEVVLPVIDKDDTVCETIRQFKPDIYCNGGDRLPDNTPEVQVCKELGIEMKWNVGGGKVESSSELVRKAHASHPETVSESY